MGLKEARILAEAAANIAQYGWVQGEFGSRERGFCTTGALNEVLPPPSVLESYPAAKEYVNEIIEEFIFSWNDRKERTEDDVVETLLAASLIALDFELPLLEYDQK